MRPSVAVLLAAFNGKKYINEQIESVLQQKNVDITIFVNVDKSTDGTEDYIKELSINETRIKFLEFGNVFGSAAKNFYHLIKNINFENYDYIALSDQDDIWNNDKIDRSIKKIKENNCDGYSSNVTAFWKNNKTFVTQKSQKQRLFDHYFESAGPGCTYLLSQALLNKFKNFIFRNEQEVSEFQHHDWLIYAFAREKNLRWFIDDHSTLRYRQHPANELGVNTGFKAFFERLKQVLSGEGVRKYFKLSQLLKFKVRNVQYSNTVKRYDSFYFFLNSKEFRRRPRDQLLFKFYWLAAFCLGLKKETFRLNFISLFNILIVISCFFIIYLILIGDNSKIKIYQIFGAKEFLAIIFISAMYNLITSLRIITTINIINKSKITFFNWNNFFVQGQILGYLIPQSGVVYRAIILKNLYKLKYSNYISIYIFLISIELFLLSIIFIISLIFINLNIKDFNNLVYVPILYIFAFTLFSVICIFFFNSIKKNIKKFTNRIIRNLFTRIQIVFIKFMYNHKYLLMLSFISIIKIGLGVLLYFIVLGYFVDSVNLREIIYFFSANQLFEPLKVTPQNLGLMELVFAFIAVQVSLSMKIGIYMKIILRIIDMISLLILLFIQRVTQIILYKNNKSLV